MIELREHQQKAVDLARSTLDRWGVALLALEPRLGKTLCALTLAREIAGEGKVLFVSKKAALGSILADSDAMGGWDDTLTACNFEGLHKLKFGGFSVVIIDECHRCSAFPRMGTAAKNLRKICAGVDGVILLSGTPAIESSAQWFHIFHVTGKGPWRHYKNFYGWFKDYGIPEQIRIAGGQMVNCYKKVIDKVADDVKPYAVCMTQQDVGFKQKAQVITHKIKDDVAIELGERLRKHGIVEDLDLVAETAAAVLQKQAMVCGGTFLDDEGEVGFTGSKAKIDYLKRKLEDGKQYAIFTQYIAERAFIAKELKESGQSVTMDMDEFRSGAAQIFIGSIKRWCEGVDLSWLNGSMIIYSLTFSGSTYAQILDRMNNWNRTEPIKVHVLMVENSVEEAIFAAVSQKQSFNERFYRA